MIILKKSSKEFKRLVGISKILFEKLCKCLNQANEKKSITTGRPPKLNIQEKLLILLCYYREYRTQLSIGVDFNVSESTVCRTIRSTEEILIKFGGFHIDGKNKLLDSSLKSVVIDVTEVEIERPRKKQKEYYSGKKKKHTIKIQVVCSLDKNIICINIEKGKVHDFRIFKESKLPIYPETAVLVDLGYKGIEKIVKNVEIPAKKSKNKQLTKTEKHENKEKSRRRIVVENVNALIKTFKIFSTKYRNRRNKLSLRINLVCAWINFDLGL